MPSFAVRYRSRGELREVRWTDGLLTAEPLVQTLVAALIRNEHVVRPDPEAPGWPAGPAGAGGSSRSPRGGCS